MGNKFKEQAKVEEPKSEKPAKENKVVRSVANRCWIKGVCYTFKRRCNSKSKMVS